MNCVELDCLPRAAAPRRAHYVFAALFFIFVAVYGSVVPLESQRLDLLLTRAGLKILGGTVLFRLCATPQAGLWFTHLARHGLLVRPFAQQPDWLRFGLPGTEAEWARLEAALHFAG